MPKKSKVWDYFIQSTKKKNCSICNICSSAISNKDGNTSAMIKHLKTMHGIDLQNENNVVEEAITPKRLKTLDTFVVRKSLEEIVSEMAAFDNISIRAITKSSFIRESFSKQGYKLPKAERDVMRLIHNFYETKKNEVKELVREKLKKGQLYSITLDEWTSVRMRKYLNINIHSNDNEMINLGLIRNFNSCSAIQLVEKVEHHLNVFNINFKNHIVGSTSDGASVMVKFGKESPVLFNLCVNHTIHLAICEVLYKKKYPCQQNEEEIKDGSNMENLEDECSDCTENDAADEFLDETNDDEMEEKGEFEISNLYDLYRNIENVRKIIKYFKKSTVRNNILQDHIKTRRGTELQLVLDVKTRWNSLLEMITVFLTVILDITETLKDIGNLSLLENVNIPLLEELKQCLRPIKLTVDVLSRDNANLATGKLAITFMLEKLQEINGTLSKEIEFSKEQ